MSKLLKLIAALGLVIGFAVPANAGLVLVIDEGNDGADITCADGDACDADTVVNGEIVYIDDLADWNIAIISGDSDEGLYESTLITNLNIDYTGGDDGAILAITVYDDDYSSPIGDGVASTEIDGSNLDGDLDACSYIDGNEIACDSDLNQGEELTGSIDYTTTDPFELSQVLVFTADTGDEFVLDATTTFSTLPEPAVLGLLGLGLIGVGAARRRRKIAA